MKKVVTTLFISIISLLVILLIIFESDVEANSQQDNLIEVKTISEQKSNDPITVAVIEELIEKYNNKLSNTKKNEIVTTIIAESNRTNIDPFLITSIICVESSFNPLVKSKRGASGLMQISKTVAKMMNISDIYNINDNIYGGCSYLKILSEQFKSEELILAAYNAGPTRVRKLGRVPNYKETISYIKKVNQVKNDLYQMQIQKQQERFKEVKTADLMKKIKLQNLLN
ncbi:MAG TPA: lytic transglycosylase domain-containing protein [Bacillota bacterium]|nr:lytic transglycosylase domain-containing protein [Bacillota bacterium]HOL10253.1 lytic transglycosylase domain-containing protein [Bacillota bacterium]